MPWTLDHSMPIESRSPVYPTHSLSSPPSYEEAIQQSLQDLNPDTAPSYPHLQPEPSGLTPGDYTDAVAALHDIDERDIEDERDYEESRPLKMGRIPDARAQYTFIQPSDSASIGNSGNRDCVCNRNQSSVAGVMSHQQPLACTVHSSGSAFPSIPPSSSSSRSLLHAPSAPMAPASFESFEPFEPPSFEPSSSTVTRRNSRLYSHPQEALMGKSNDTDSDQYTTFQTQSTPYTTLPQLQRPLHPPATAPLAGIPDTPGDLMNVQDVSIADYKRTKRGAESYDKILEDPYQLYRFFVAHNDRPKMHLLIRGKTKERYQSG